MCRKSGSVVGGRSSQNAVRNAIARFAANQSRKDIGRVGCRSSASVGAVTRSRRSGESVSNLGGAERSSARR